MQVFLPGVPLAATLLQDECKRVFFVLFLLEKLLQLLRVCDGYLVVVEVLARGWLVRRRFTQHVDGICPVGEEYVALDFAERPVLKLCAQVVESGLGRKAEDLEILDCDSMIKLLDEDLELGEDNHGGR